MDVDLGKDKKGPSQGYRAVVDYMVKIMRQRGYGRKRRKQRFLVAMRRTRDADNKKKEGDKVISALGEKLMSSSGFEENPQEEFHKLLSMLLLRSSRFWLSSVND